MSNSILEVNNLTHSYSHGAKQVQAITEICFHLNPKEIVAIEGASGSGKTTLLLACGGMLKPTSGSIQVRNEDLYGLSGEQRNRIRSERIGYVFQTLQLVPYLSVLDNLTLHHKATRADVLEWLERFGLEDRLRHFPHELSHGQRQRVALIRAIAHQPDILIADEPTGNLDSANSDLVYEILRHFADSGGGVLVASHDPMVAQRSDRTLKLKSGKILTPESTSKH